MIEILAAGVGVEPPLETFASPLKPGLIPTIVLSLSHFSLAHKKTKG